MNRLLRTRAGAALGALLSAFLWALPVSAAESHPAELPRLIVPFAPGGAADILGRIVGDHLQRELGKPVVNLNQEGAGTVIGVDAAAEASADGHTLLPRGGAATINAASGRTLPSDLMRDLAPVSLVFAGTQVVVGGARDDRSYALQELLKHPGSNPGTLKIGTSAIATATHLPTETTNTAARIQAGRVAFMRKLGVNIAG